MDLWLIKTIYWKRRTHKCHRVLPRSLQRGNASQNKKRSGLGVTWGDGSINVSMPSLALSLNNAAALTTSRCAALTWPCGHNGRIRRGIFGRIFHMKAETLWMSPWQLTLSQAVRRKPRWSLANVTPAVECFSLSTVAGTGDNIFLYFGSICCQALIMPSTGGETCVFYVCVCVS